MPPKQPPRLRICVADVISQPLNALPAAINALLKRTNGLDEVETEGLFHETGHILRRAEEALLLAHQQQQQQQQNDHHHPLGGEETHTSRRGREHSNPAADAVIGSCFRLLQHGFVACVTSGSLCGLRAFTEDDNAFDALGRIVVAAVEGRGTCEEAQCEILNTLDYLCEGALSKERIGAAFMPVFLRVLADPTRPYRVHRGVATDIVNLVKGSKANKDRLGDLGCVAGALAATSDYFLQLQCTEVLFRATRTKKTALDALAPLLSADFVQGMQALPTDRTLLERMMRLVDAWNAARTPALVLRFPLQRVEVGNAVLCGPTAAYFAPEFFVVMIPGTAADNVTIPHSALRSVRLTKDSKVVFRLASIPPLLADRVALATADLAEGRGSGGAAGGSSVSGSGAIAEDVALLCTPMVLAEFRRSSIHTWITNVLREANRTAAAATPKTLAPLETAGSAVAVPAGGVAPTPTSGRRTGGGSTGKRPRGGAAATGATTGVDGSNSSSAGGGSSPTVGRVLDDLRSPPRSGAAAAAAAAVAVPVLPPGVATLNIRGDDADASLQSSGASSSSAAAAAKRQRREAEAAAAANVAFSLTVANPIASAAVSATGAMVAPAAVATTTNATLSRARSLSVVPSASLLPNAGAAARAGVVPPEVQRQPSLQQHVDAHADAILAQLRSVIDEKVRRKREEATAMLVATMGAIQTLVDDAKARTAEELDVYARSVHVHIDSVRNEQDAALQQVVEAVTSINGTMQEVKTLAQDLREQTNALEAEFSTVAAECRDRETNVLRQLKARIETDMLALEMNIQQRVASDSSFSFLTSFVSRKMDEDGYF